MTDLRKAAEMALEALDSENPDIQLRAAVALRQALAQPVDETANHEYVLDCPRCGHCCPNRKWVGLTDQEINNSYMFWVVDQQDVIGFGKSLETKIKRKNT